MTFPFGPNQDAALLHTLIQLPMKAVQWMKYKVETAALQKMLLKEAVPLTVGKYSYLRLKQKLRWQLQLAEASGGTAWGKSSTAALTDYDQAVVSRIRADTDKHNRNNVTRTHAYLRLYESHSELEWALLAHMVSRNGGWNMTDLKGEWLPSLLSENTRMLLFDFLETANSFIFGDAYPQLLLYQESVKEKRALFYLLPHFGVSRFMRAVWEVYWEERDRTLLAISLVINEQHYIHERVVQQPKFRDGVLDTLYFQAQSLLQLNQVIFPYVVTSKGNEPSGESCRLAGLILENFSSLHERIAFGQKLYSLLFGIPDVHRRVTRFALQRQHTGSRSDYWPDLYTPVRRAPPMPRGQLQPQLEEGRLKSGADPLYSPKLSTAWKDRPLLCPEEGDWFAALSVMDYIRSIKPPSSFEITQAYRFGLTKLELAALAGGMLKD